jgi:hypothetical protein
MTVAFTSETLVSYCKTTTRRHTLEQTELKLHRRENLKFVITKEKVKVKGKVVPVL